MYRVPFKLMNRAKIFSLLESPGIDSKESILPAYVAWAGICRRLWSPGIDSEKSIPPVYVAWRAGTTNRFAVPSRQDGNRFLGSLKGLRIRALAGRYNNPIPTRFLSPGCLKIAAQGYIKTYAKGLSILQYYTYSRTHLYADSNYMIPCKLMYNYMDTFKFLWTGAALYARYRFVLISNKL